MLLALENVSKTYGSLRVASELSLTLESGQALGIIGPNGAGKTTMLNLIGGNTTPDAGRVLLQGRDITRLDPAARCRLGIGRTYQIPHPFTGMTVFENTLVGATFGTGRSERTAAPYAVAALERTGLLDKANRLAGSLPLLDRKRLELARALATSPDVLLLDEIAGGLTEHEVQDLIEIVRQLRAEGVAIIWIEHIVHALMAVVDEIAVISGGSLLTRGDPATVMADPAVRDIYMGMEIE